MLMSVVGLLVFLCLLAATSLVVGVVFNWYFVVLLIPFAVTAFAFFLLFKRKPK